jgi:hypothetical protein
VLETAGYEFQRFDAFEQQWKAVEAMRHSRRTSAPDLALELVIEGRPHPAAP